MKPYCDLGGTPNKEGKHILPNRIIRSGCLNHLRPRHAKELRAHRLVKVIDLRTEVEIADRPDRSIDGVRFVHIPVFEERVVGITREKKQNYVEMLRGMRDIADLYQAMVTDPFCVAHLGEVVREIVFGDQYAVLYHCTAGKDRTGLITMLLLTLLDVDEAVILQDYLAINRRQRPVAIACYLLGMLLTFDKRLALKAKDYFTAKPEYLLGAMQTISQQYGSVSAFIRDRLGVDDEAKAAFKAKMLQ